MQPYRYDDNLRGTRIYTRMLTPEDAKPWLDFISDDEATKFLINHNNTSGAERAKFWIERQLNRYATQQYGLQAIIDKSTEEFIGQVGLLHQNVEGVTEVEIGYHILPKYWGQGYAAEAARLFINYAFSNNVSSVISMIDVLNFKSQRVAEKNGLVKEKQIRWSELDIYIYRINNPDLHKN